ncbi:MAG TPA: Hsp20/alpha crystallin family protein [Clostridia bacterium]|nr:Hsp20/alpha crystallin family protein [Clostridia bacterium]
MKLRRREPQESGSMAPISEMDRIRHEINRIFEEPFSLMRQGSSFFEGWEPALDVYENNDRITVRAELPGMKKEDISVSLEENTLTISGERKREEERKEGEVFRSERYFGRFQRIVTLSQPVDVNQIQANYKDGVLTINLPKAEAAKPKQIEVKTS